MRIRMSQSEASIEQQRLYNVEAAADKRDFKRLSLYAMARLLLHALKRWRGYHWRNVQGSWDSDTGGMSAAYNLAEWSRLDRAVMHTEKIVQMLKPRDLPDIDDWWEADAAS